MIQEVIRKKHRKFFLVIITRVKNADAQDFLICALHLYVYRRNNFKKYSSVLLVAHLHAQAFTACHGSVCYKGDAGEWKVLENDGHVSGKGDAGYPSSGLF